jgi:sugar-specific transcriptional regulator TrmB
MERAIQLLKQLGLTEYEARAYASLVASGASTAGELSELAAIPYSRIYDVLSRLERRGWIESQSGRPARYRARPPSEVLRVLMAEEERKLRELSERVVRELEPLYERRGEVKRPEVWIIRGWSNIISKISDMLARASAEVLVSLPTIPPELLKLAPSLSVLCERGVSIRILTSSRRRWRPARGIQIRRRDTLFGGGMIVDGKEVLLVLGSGSGATGLWSSEPGLTRFAREYFEYLWRDSEPFK